jgi:hypothetical protein
MGDHPGADVGLPPLPSASSDAQNDDDAASPFASEHFGIVLSLLFVYHYNILSLYCMYIATPEALDSFLNTPQDVPSTSTNDNDNDWLTTGEFTPTGKFVPAGFNVDDILGLDVGGNVIMDTFTPPTTPAKRDVPSENRDVPPAPKKQKPESAVNTVSGNPCTIPTELQRTPGPYGPGKNAAVMKAMCKSSSASGPDNNATSVKRHKDKKAPKHNKVKKAHKHDKNAGKHVNKAGKHVNKAGKHDNKAGKHDKPVPRIKIIQDKGRPTPSTTVTTTHKSSELVSSDVDSSNEMDDDDNKPITITKKRKATSASGPPKAKKANTGVAAGHKTTPLVFSTHGGHCIVIGLVGDRDTYKKQLKPGSRIIGSGFKLGYNNESGCLEITYVHIIEETINSNAYTFKLSYSTQRTNCTKVCVDLAKSDKPAVWIHSRQVRVNGPDGKPVFKTTQPADFGGRIKAMVRANRHFPGSEYHLCEMLTNLLWGNVTNVNTEMQFVRVAMTIMHDLRNTKIACMHEILAFLGFDTNGSFDIGEYGVNFYHALKQMPTFANGSYNISIPRKNPTPFASLYAEDNNTFGTKCKVYTVRLAQLLFKIVGFSLLWYEMMDQSTNICTNAVRAYKDRLNNPATAEKNNTLDNLEQNIGETTKTIQKLTEEREALEYRLKKAEKRAKLQEAIVQSQGEKLGDLRAQQEQERETGATIADQQATIANQQTLLEQLKRDLDAAKARNNQLVTAAEEIDNELVTESNVTKRLRREAKTAIKKRDEVVKMFTRKSARAAKPSLKAKEAMQQH